jgi:hypothetical protein
MADPPPGRFQLLITPVRMDELRQLATTAATAGRKTSFIRWLREVRYRLAHEADEWGEGRDVLPALGLETRVGVVGDLSVWYAVDADRGRVYVKQFRMRGDPGAGPVGGV